MEKKILVTEASEITASEVVRQLLAWETPVRIVTGSPGQIAHIQGKRVEIAMADYRDPDSMRDLFKDIAGVYLGVSFSWDLADMVRNLVAAARTYEVEHIVFHSVMGADAATTTIAQWHQKAERHIKASGISFTFLRPNFVMQDFLTRQGENIRREDKIIAPLGDARISYVDARDVAACAAECLTAESCHGKGYTLTGPEALSLYDVAAILSDVMGRTIEYKSVSEDEARRRLEEEGAPGWLIEAHIDRHERYRVGGIGAETTSSVKDITGREPHNFRVFAETHADSWITAVEA